MTAHPTAPADLPVWSPDQDAAGEIDASADSGLLEPVTEPHVGLAPEHDAAGAPPKKRSRGVLYFLGVGTLVLAVGISFAVGRATAPGGSTGLGTTGGQNAGQFGPGGNGGALAGEGLPNGGFGGFDRGGGPSVEGTVVSFDGTTLTVKLADGSTVALTTSSSTTYKTAQAASVSDVTAGKTVTVQVNGAPGSTTRNASSVTVSGN